MVAVGIIGALAAIAVPIYGGWRDNAARTAFATSLRAHANAIVQYMSESGQLPAGAPRGSLPPDLQRYVRAQAWVGKTPIAGMWDLDTSRRRGWTRIAVDFMHRENPGPAFMRQVDAAVDDGDLSAGFFRRISTNKYGYYITR